MIRRPEPRYQQKKEYCVYCDKNVFSLEDHSKVCDFQLIFKIPNNEPTTENSSNKEEEEEINKPKDTYVADDLQQYDRMETWVSEVGDDDDFGDEDDFVYNQDNDEKVFISQ